MKAIIRQGEHLLFLSGASGHNLLDIKDTLIINFYERYIYDGFKFFKKMNALVVYTSGDNVDLIIRFSSPVDYVIFDHFCKDQLVLKIVKSE